jgi:hypothetical protein
MNIYLYKYIFEHNLQYKMISIDLFIILLPVCISVVLLILDFIMHNDAYTLNNPK